MQGIGCYFQKIFFNFNHRLQTKYKDQKSDRIIIFGRSFDSNQQARQMINSLVYLTYREDLQLGGVTNNTDAGWGCMLRVVTMLVAQVLKRYQGPNFFDNPQHIYSLFIDKKGPFSMERLLQQSWNLFSKKAGDWFSSNQVSKIIAFFINEDTSTELRVFVCDGKLSKETCLNFLMMDKMEVEYNQQSVDLQVCKNLSNFIFQEKVQIKPGLIIINIKQGLALKGQQGEDKLRQLKRAMNLQSFTGILGGRSGRAHYIVGYSQTSFIYLDPHQVSTNKEFHTKDMLSMEFTKADPDMSICFYVRNHEDFLEVMENIDDYLYKNLCLEPSEAFQLEDTLPQISMKIVQKTSGISDQSTQQFELLAQQEYEI